MQCSKQTGWSKANERRLIIAIRDLRLDLDLRERKTCELLCEKPTLVIGAL